MTILKEMLICMSRKRYSFVNYQYLGFCKKTIFLTDCIIDKIYSMGKLPENSQLFQVFQNE